MTPPAAGPAKCGGAKCNADGNLSIIAKALAPFSGTKWHRACALPRVGEVGGSATIYAMWTLPRASLVLWLQFTAAQTGGYRGIPQAAAAAAAGAGGYPLQGRVTGSQERPEGTLDLASSRSLLDPPPPPRAAAAAIAAALTEEQLRWLASADVAELHSLAAASRELLRAPLSAPLHLDDLQVAGASIRLIRQPRAGDSEQLTAGTAEQAEVAHALARRLLASGDHVQALRAFERAQQLLPHEPAAFANAAVAHAGLGNYTAAVRTLRTALSLEPRDVGTHCNLAKALLLDQGRIAEVPYRK